LRTHQKPVLDPEEIAALESSFARTQEFAPKQIVVREQVPLTQCTLLLEGFVERYKDMPDGRRQILAIHVPGDFVDLHSYPLKKLEHSVAALTPIRVAFMPHSAVRALTMASPHLTVGPAGFVGSVRLGAMRGDPGTPADEADVPIRVQLTDIRRAGDLSDYPGEVELALDLQITDAQPLGDAAELGTTTRISYSVPVDCAATVDTATGGSCEITTSADTIAPGTIREGWRTLWQLGQVRVLDGGADDRAATADNVVFATQGIFVP